MLPKNTKEEYPLVIINLVLRLIIRPQETNELKLITSNDLGQFYKHVQKILFIDLVLPH